MGKWTAIEIKTERERRRDRERDRDRERWRDRERSERDSGAREIKIETCHTN